MDTDTLRSIMATQAAASADPDPLSVLTLITRRAVDLTGADGAKVERAEGDAMVCRAAAGISEPHPEPPLTLMGSLSGLCVRRGQILRSDDTTVDPRVDTASCRVSGIESVLVAPVISNNATVGVLKVVGTSQGQFGEQEVEVVSMLAGLTADAVDQLQEPAATRGERRGLTDARSRHRLQSELALMTGRLDPTMDDRLAVVSIEVEGISTIGEQFGDQVGAGLAGGLHQRLQGVTRSDDLVAQVGFDEFVVVADLLDRTRSTGHDGEQAGLDADGADALAEVLATRLERAFDHPLEILGRDVPIRVNVGYATTGDPDESPRTLIARAHAASSSVRHRARTGPPERRRHAVKAPPRPTLRWFRSRSA